MPPINFRLLLVTDRHQTQGRALSMVLQQAVKAGVPAIQLRERDLSTQDLLALTKEVQVMTAPRSIPLLVNDRIDLVVALNAAGVHLRSNSMPVSVARRLLGVQRLIGISTHSLSEVRQANDEGADYVVLGPVFETPAKRQFGPPLGLNLLEAACGESRVPVFAIGGINAARAQDARRAGAHGVAVIGAILARDDIAVATKELLASLE